MDKKRTAFSFLLILLALGCDKETPVTPTPLPPSQAQLELLPTVGEYFQVIDVRLFEVTIREHAGVGVTINSIEITQPGGGGWLLDRAWIVNGVGTDRIQPNGTWRSGGISLNGAGPQRPNRCILNATDDNGNSFEIRERL